MEKDLRELRKKRGLTVEQLEERSECGRGFITRLEGGYSSIDNCRMGSAYKVAIVLGVSLDEFYHIAKNTKPTHKVGNPFMVTGQPAKVRGDSWKYRRNDGVERPQKVTTGKRGRPSLKPAQNILEEKE